MTSKTFICNRALLKVGANAILNVDTDDSKEASSCRAVYDGLLEEVLRIHDWSFATFRQKLNKDTSAFATPAYGYSYRYILPTVPKFIKLVEIENEPDFRLENNFIITNESNVNIKFVGKEIDPNKYDPLFIHVLATRIALEICTPLTKDDAKQTKLKQELEYSISLAKDKDIQEGKKAPITNSLYNNARTT